VRINVHNCRTQYSTVRYLIIFPLILQKSTRAQMLSIGGGKVLFQEQMKKADVETSEVHPKNGRQNRRGGGDSDRCSSCHQNNGMKAL